MTEDSNKYRYTRAFAGASLGSIVAITFYLMIVVTISPDKSEALATISGPIIITISVLGGVIGAYMGISNNWGKK